MKKDILRVYTNLLIAPVTIVFNILANALPLNNQYTGEISDRFQVYFVPAGYVFSIWGVIYLGWLAYAIYQFIPSQRQNPRLRRIGYLFPLNGLANIAWLFLWHYEQFVFTLLAMLIVLFTLVAIYLRLDIGRQPIRLVERWCVDIPFSLYLGWITVATIANVTAVLDFLRWDAWGLAPEVWTVTLLIVGVALGFAIALTRRDVPYLLVLLWAFIGIAVKHSAVTLVALSAWAAAAFIVLWTLLALWQARSSRAALP